MTEAEIAMMHLQANYKQNKPTKTNKTMTMTTNKRLENYPGAAQAGQHVLERRKFRFG